VNDSNTSGSIGGATPAQSPIKQALAAIRDLRAQLDAVQARETEPIAIVGMSCRYPGCADLASFWRLLLEGRDAVTEVPADRWSLDAFYDPDPSRPGKMTSRWAGVIDRLDEFDAAFFGISPREAPHVDPRQRLALELMWEALEQAGIPPDSLAGTLTGVFMATLTNDYDHLLFDDLRRADAYSGAGTANSIVANRLSYFLDVRGPSLALDTACSGSLVAVHLACESLRRGESTLALAGGVNVNLMPKSNVFFSKAGALSPSGRCKTFDGRADGMVRSDGAGVIVLKRLSDARRDGDRVIAVIKGSAVNHDGRSNGLMAPNGDAQKAVLTDAYRRAGVTPASVQYIEAHGTGTKLGDPIEVQALGEVLTADRPADRKCLLGSLKTNVGHTEAAAGIGGLIKTALALSHRVIPPAVHFSEPNPLIPFDRLPFEVPREASAWPSPDAPLVAGVSGFGFGGTNAHVVLQDAASVAATASAGATDDRAMSSSAATGRASASTGAGQSPTSASSAAAGLPATATAGHDAPPYILACSARTPRALRQLAENLRDRLIATAIGADEMNGAAALKSAGEQDVASARDGVGAICAAAALGRTHHRASRLAIVGDSRDGLREVLERRLAEMDVDAAPAAGGGSGRLVFVFSGQGSHWPRMGQRLAAREPVFKAALGECDRLFASLLKTSIVEEIAREAETSRLNETALTQPAIFSMQIALTALWRSFGVTPDTVIGHSLGEVAAACAAGVITLEEGVHIVYHRSRLMTRAAGHGRTIVVGLSFDDARELVKPFEPALAVAGSNGPGTSVIAGDPASIADLMRTLESRGTFCRAIQGVDIAFHSPQMDPLRDELVEALSGDPAIATSITLAPRAAKVPLVSTVTGTWVNGETLDATYWGRNLRDPFLFARAIGMLLGNDGNVETGKSGIRACLEISPDAVLSSSIAQCARGVGQPSLPILSSMRRTTDEPLHLLEQIARLYELGESVQWRGIHRSRRHASLPTYPWQRQRFWFDQLTPAEPLRADSKSATSGSHLTHIAQGERVARGANAAAAATVATATSALHPLLGEAIESASTSGAERVYLWQLDMDAARPAWVADHKVLGDVMVPGAAMLEMALAAARQTWDTHATIAVSGMTFDQPIRLDVPRLLQVTLTIRGTEADFTLHSRPANSRDAWTKHATARVLSGVPAASDSLHEPIAEIAARSGTETSVDAHYAAMAADGLEYGAAFRGIKRLWANAEPSGGGEGEGSSSAWGEAFAEIEFPSAADASDVRYAMHPAMLDAAFQTVAAAVGRDDRQRYLPRGVANWRVVDVVGDRVWCHVRVSARGPEGLTADIDLLNDAGRIVARVDGLSLVRFGAPRRNPLEDALLEERWEQVELAIPASDASRVTHAGARTWLIFADATGVGEALTARLRANGENVTVARWGTAWRRHDTHFELCASERGDMDRLLTVAASINGRIDHVVHLWSLDTRSPEAYGDCETAAAVLDTAETLAAGSTLHLAQALVQAGSTARLWLTTRGTQAVNAPIGSAYEGSARTGSPHAGRQHAGGFGLDAVSAPAVISSAVDERAGNTPTMNLLASHAFRALNSGAVEIQQAAVNGLALTIGQEHPELRCTTIDLDGASRAPAQVTSLTAELLADDRETRVALRRGIRYAARLVAAPWPREAPAPAQTTPVETTPVEAMSVETPPVETSPVETMSAEATPVETSHESSDGLTADRALATGLAANLAAADRGRATRGKTIRAGAGLPLRGDATYLITGGLGALGLRTAAAFARLGAGHLVLTGRRGIESLGDTAVAAIRAIERTGTAVTIARADVSSVADVEALFGDVLSKLPPLRGVIHAAGVLDDALIAQQSIDRFRTVMAPKLRGTWNLHVHTRALPLDFFVCYSSAASLVGSPGQANYAAGNACMDAIVHHRRALRLAASSINWGAWGEEGMAANAAMHARLAARGVTPIATSDGLALLSRLLRDTIVRPSADPESAAGADTAIAAADRDGDIATADRGNRHAGAERPAVFGVMPVVWRTFLKQFPAGVPSRFEKLVPASSEGDSSSASASSEADASNAAASSAAVLALRALTSNDRRRRLQQMLRDTLAAVLGFGAPLELGPREKYFDLGMDSLLSVEFRNRLQQTFSIALPATLAFEYPTIETLAEHVDAQLAERFRSDGAALTVAHADGTNGANVANVTSIANGVSAASGATANGENGGSGGANGDRDGAVLPATLDAASRDADDADALDVLPTDEIARLLAAELSEEAVRVR
jgi:myxalamid-type polyketide synthase MxaE and MxaD